jgi:DNA-binding XRE family transcriptional regulator
MILKQLRISRQITQEQLALMSGLNVRTIQRIESGQKPSVESLKCLASALEVEISTLNQEVFMIDKSGENWKKLPFWLKCCFSMNLMLVQPSRAAVNRGEVLSHASGFLFCLLGLVNQAALVGGLLMLANGYLFHFLMTQGDKLGIWYDLPDGHGT